MFMQFIKPNTRFDFVGNRRIAFAVALLLIGISLSVLLIKTPRYGIDFSGGTLIQVQFSGPVQVEDIRDGLRTIDISASTIQRFGPETDYEFLIRTDAANTITTEMSHQIENALKDATTVSAKTRRVEMVGPQIGQELREKALFTMFYALLFITVYISGRFERKWLKSALVAAVIIGVVYGFSLFKLSIPVLIFVAMAASLVVFWVFSFNYALSATLVQINDVLVTVGIFSLFGKEYTLPIIAALLTIIGYSLNNTIVIFDRIRENLRLHPKMPMAEISNKSINETLSRTILSSGTTLIVVVALFILGGGIIHDFSFALLIGIVVGTYSSIFVATPLLLVFFQRRRK